ncbi:MAG: hypothetical protein Alpg2KO_03890 [Alphaproteobacteria bacterium]
MTATDARSLFFEQDITQSRPSNAEYKAAFEDRATEVIDPVPALQSPFILALLGGPGSGKSWLADRLPDNDHMVRLDIDRTTLWHPQWRLLLDDDPYTAPHRARSTALRFLINAKSRAIELARPILLEDCPQGGNWADSAFRPFIKAGWDILVIPLDCPIKSALSRCQQRFDEWDPQHSPFPRSLNKSELEDASANLQVALAQLATMPRVQIISSDDWPNTAQSRQIMI